MTRKSNKHFFKKNRDGSITFKSQELLNGYNKKIIEKETEIYRDLMYNEVLDDVVKQTDVIARDVLKRKWGFGKKRQDDFINAFNFQVDCIKDGLVSLEDIEKLNKGEIE